MSRNSHRTKNRYETHQDARRTRKRAQIEAMELRPKLGSIDASDRFAMRTHTSPHSPTSNLGAVRALPAGVRVFGASIPNNEIDGGPIASWEHNDNPTDVNNVANNSKRAIGMDHMKARHFTGAIFQDNALGDRVLAPNIDGALLKAGSIPQGRLQALDLGVFKNDVANNIATVGNDIEQKSLKALKEWVVGYAQPKKRKR
jgi:hypothetical protein